MRPRRIVVPVLGALLSSACVIGCGSPQTPEPTATELVDDSICPPMGEANDAIETAFASRTPPNFSRPPKTFATAHGVTVEMIEGESEWCGTISDVFHTVTSDVPLTVRPGETITIPNPLPREHIWEARVGFAEPTTSPTPNGGVIIWASGPSSGPGHNIRYDAKGVTFDAASRPGRYVVNVWLRFADREDMFASSNREAYWALLLDVAE